MLCPLCQQTRLTVISTHLVNTLVFSVTQKINKLILRNFLVFLFTPRRHIGGVKLEFH